MKKLILPLPESFTIHAVALINKVHTRLPNLHWDEQYELIRILREEHSDSQTVEAPAINSNIPPVERV